MFPSTCGALPPFVWADLSAVQMAFYGYYHTKHGNQIIHFFFVPAIAWSVAVWLAYVGPLFGVDLPSHLHDLPASVAEYALHLAYSLVTGLGRLPLITLCALH